MANPRGNLAGWSDPSKPGWQKRVLEKVRENQKGTKRHTERTSGTLATYDEPFRLLLEEACKRRNISRQGYARRAIAAFIAYDLGINIADVLKHCARPVPLDTRINYRPVRTEDTGEGFGAWGIVEAEEL